MNINPATYHVDSNAPTTILWTLNHGRLKPQHLSSSMAYGTDVESAYLKKNPADAVGARTFSLAEATSAG